MWVILLAYQIGICQNPQKNVSKCINHFLNYIEFASFDYIRYVRGVVANSITTAFVAYVHVVTISLIVIIMMILLKLVSCSSRNSYFQLLNLRFSQNLHFIHRMVTGEPEDFRFSLR